MTPNPNLGKQGKDVVTGFTGTITGYAEYLTGSSRYEITIYEMVVAQVKSYWFDVERVEILELPVKILPGNKASQ